MINAITGQDIALVSKVAGTTTDPVYKAMELLPLGPVVLIDTAGLDDVGEIGELRIKKTKEVMDKTDLAILLFSADSFDYSLEKEWLSDLKDRNIPVIGIKSILRIGPDHFFKCHLFQQRPVRNILEPFTFIADLVFDPINLRILQLRVKGEVCFISKIPEAAMQVDLRCH